MRSEPTTSTEQWQRLERLFDEAMHRSGAERDAFAREACGEDTELLRQLLSMLEHAEKASHFEHPAWQATPGPASPVEDRTGQLFGAYRLVRLLGRGGMGTVWLAERDDQEFEGQAAVKLLSSSCSDEEAIRLFRNERQLLAGLRHPHIASLLDGGTTDDQQPYLVMEYIDGVRIDQYCRQHRLGIHERIELFLGVCDAVEHAHRRLVIHRDIKPSNILVSQAGEVKLLDFGIAKVLESTDAEDATRTQHRRLTPRYSSPEQFAGAALTTATDVYALGVVLYELLTRQSPYRNPSTSVHELILAVCEGEVVPPSKAALPDDEGLRSAGDHAWRKTLSGNLDAVILRCMARDAQDRYPSVERLRADLVAYLDGREVSARRPGWMERLGRRIRRHRVASIALAAGTLALMIGFGVGLHQFLRARHAWGEEAEQRVLAETRLTDLQGLHRELAREKEEVEEQRNLAVRRARDIQELAHTAVFDIANEAASHAPTAALKRIVEVGLGALERLREQAQGDPVLLGEIAISYTRLGVLWSGYGSHSLGQLVEAEKAIESGVSLAQQSYDLDPERPGGSYVLARTLWRLAGLRRQQGRFDEALEIVQRATVLCRPLGHDDAKIGYRSLLYHCLCSEGVILAELGRNDESRALLAESEEGRRKLVEEAPTYFDFMPNLADVIHHRVILDQREGRVSRALEGAREAEDLIRRSLELYPGDRRIVRIHVALQLTLAELQQVVGDVDGAEQTLSELEVVMAALRETDPDSLTHAADEVVLIGLTADLYAHHGDELDAEETLDRAIERLEFLRENAPGYDRADLILVQLLVQRAEFFCDLGFHDEAFADLDESAQLLDRMAASYGRSELQCRHASVRGRIWKQRAAEESDPAQRRAFLENARAAYQEALKCARSIGLTSHESSLEREIRELEQSLRE